MVDYKTPKRDYEFILKEVLDVEHQIKGYKGYEEATWDMIEMLSDQYSEVATDYWLPSNKDGDELGAQFKD